MQNESSIDAQIYGVKEYCEKHGYCLVNTYIDFGISGTTDQRPQFQQMIEDGKKRQFDAVIVHKGDRFARSEICRQPIKRYWQKIILNIFQ